ncbi:MAG TPA: VirB3 family type IV secretion system protein [Polyangiales bacterium]|nr:VirB3 family type IV secretion system protein [Polyangiales bacterium]
MLRALTKPPLLLHCDRDLLVLAGGVCGLMFIRLGLLEGNVYWLVASPALFLLAMTLLAIATKRDPQWKDVLLRACRYRLPLQGAVIFARAPRWDVRARKTR